MTKKILVTGGSGLLAVNWAIFGRDKFEAILGLNERIVQLSGTRCVKIDISSIQSIRETLASISPDIVINTAGLTSVEVCEQFPLLAQQINTDIAVNMAIACAETSTRFVHISTDHLFSGDRPLLTEDAVTNPQNVYGLTKAKAEEGILKNNKDALIIRTNFYGWGTSYRSSFSDMIINSLRSGKNVNLFTDVFYTPILAEALIETVHHLLEKDSKGIFNVVGNERISKYDFGIDLARCFKLDESLIKRSMMKDQTDLVKRPYDMSLSNQKVCDYLDIQLMDTKQLLLRLAEQELTGLNKEINRL